MVLGRLVVIIHVMPPVCVRIVVISISTLALVDYNPWAVRMLNLVITTDPELVHLLIGIVCIKSTGISLPELVVEVN